jgi:hypothetical protein
MFVRDLRNIYLDSHTPVHLAKDWRLQQTLQLKPYNLRLKKTSWSST